MIARRTRSSWPRGHFGRVTLLPLSEFFRLHIQLEWGQVDPFADKAWTQHHFSSSYASIRLCLACILALLDQWMRSSIDEPDSIGRVLYPYVCTYHQACANLHYDHHVIVLIIPPGKESAKHECKKKVNQHPSSTYVLLFDELKWEFYWEDSRLQPVVMAIHTKAFYRILHKCGASHWSRCYGRCVTVHGKVNINICTM